MIQPHKTIGEASADFERFCVMRSLESTFLRNRTEQMLCQVFFTSNPEGGWKSRTAMTVARGDKAVAVLHDKLHVIGGETKNSAGHSTPLMDVEVQQCLLLGVSAVLNDGIASQQGIYDHLVILGHSNSHRFG